MNNSYKNAGLSRYLHLGIIRTSGTTRPSLQVQLFDTNSFHDQRDGGKIVSETRMIVCSKLDNRPVKANTDRCYPPRARFHLILSYAPIWFDLLRARQYGSCDHL